MLSAERYEEIVEELGARRALAAALDEARSRRLRKQQSARGGLIHFVRHFWRILEPNRDFQDGWALEAMCQHLESVSRGEIIRLLINVPPGSMKSLLVNVFWPAWEWGPFGRPDFRYISFSYAAHLTERDNQKFLDLVESEEYQKLWGHVIGELRDKGKQIVSNRKTGKKFATAVRGVGTGERGDRVLLDDPHNIKEGESETIRSETVRWFKEAMSNRLNDMAKSAIIVIMQRVHEDDVSGAILADELGYVHLLIPLEYEVERHCTTYVGGLPFWSDPREIEGESFWPSRFDEAAIRECKKQGPFVYAGQYQQRPEPRGGGLFKREYWQHYEPVGGKYPTFDYILASLDSAFTEKQENDPSGFTVWGCFNDGKGNRAAIPIMAWRKWLPLHGKARKQAKGESLGDYRAETEKDWGLIQWIAYEMKRFRCDHLLIENKANGHDVAVEMIRLFSHEPWSVELVDPKGLDKHARAVRVQPVFAEGLIYAAATKHTQKLIDEAAAFPRGKYKDMTDSMTQALWWLRKHSFLQMLAEFEAQALAEARHVPKPKTTALYPV